MSSNPVLGSKRSASDRGKPDRINPDWKYWICPVRCPDARGMPSWLNLNFTFMARGFAMLPNKQDAMASFVAAGLFSLTRLDTPGVGQPSLPPQQAKVYSALCRIAEMCSVCDLILLENAFDGFGEDGNPLIEETT